MGSILMMMHNLLLTLFYLKKEEEWVTEVLNKTWSNLLEASALLDSNG